MKVEKKSLGSNFTLFHVFKVLLGSSEGSRRVMLFSPVCGISKPLASDVCSVFSSTQLPRLQEIMVFTEGKIPFWTELVRDVFLILLPRSLDASSLQDLLVALGCYYRVPYIRRFDAPYPHR